MMISGWASCVSSGRGDADLRDGEGEELEGVLLHELVQHPVQHLPTQRAEVLPTDTRMRFGEVR